MRYLLQAPFLAAEAAVAASRAQRLGGPVCLAGASACGAYGVARALHRDGDRPGFVSVRTSVRAADARERLLEAVADDPWLDALTLYVEGLDRQRASLQEFVLRLIDEGLRWKSRPLPVRVIAQCDQGPRGFQALPPLARRLSTLVIPLAPLSARRADVAAIVQALARRAALELGRPPPVITPNALRHVVERDWPGDFDELEACVRRTLALCERDTVDVADLRIDGEPPEAAPASEEARPVADAASTGDSRRLQLVLSELAHELKNPMVTIKSFGQHLDKLASDPELGEKFSRLTDEAIQRMDGVLEELLRFARFSAPRERAVSLVEVLSRAVAMSDAAVRDRVSLDGVPPGVRILGDEEQLVFAFRALTRGILRQLPDEASIVLGWRASGELVFSSKTTGMARRVQTLLGHEVDDEPDTSLDFVLAQMLIHRNGGSCRIARQADQLEVRVSLRVA